MGKEGKSWRVRRKGVERSELTKSAKIGERRRGGGYYHEKGKVRNFITSNRGKGII